MNSIFLNELIHLYGNMHLGEQMNLHEQIHLYEKRTDSYILTNTSKSTDTSGRERELFEVNFHI